MAAKCNRCGENRRTWSLWRGFATAPNADVVCCLHATGEIEGETNDASH